VTRWGGRGRGAKSRDDAGATEGAKRESALTRFQSHARVLTWLCLQRNDGPTRLLTSCAQSAPPLKHSSLLCFRVAGSSLSPSLTATLAVVECRQRARAGSTMVNYSGQSMRAPVLSPANIALQTDLPLLVPLFTQLGHAPPAQARSSPSARTNSQRSPALSNSASQTAPAAPRSSKPSGPS
jgi:hypothetical protein